MITNMIASRTAIEHEITESYNKAVIFAKCVDDKTRFIPKEEFLLLLHKLYTLGFEVGTTEGNKDGYYRGYENGYNAGFEDGEKSNDAFEWPGLGK